MKWIVGVDTVAVVVGIVATMTVPAQTVTPDTATLKLFPPETQGLAFVDFAGLRSAPLFNEMVYQKLPKLPRELGEFAEATGFDIPRDVERLTLGYIGRNSVVAIVQAKYDKFKVEQFVKDKADHIQTETYLGRVIYNGGPHGDGDHAGISFIDNLIVAGSISGVKQAIDRLAAPAPSVVDGDLIPQIRTIGASNQVWAVGKFDPSMLSTVAPGIPEKAGEMLSSFKSGTYQMRIDQDLHARISGTFSTPEMAKATYDLGRGLLGVAQLQFEKEEKLKQLLGGLSMDTNGQTVTVTFNATGDLLKDLEAQKAGLLKKR